MKADLHLHTYYSDGKLSPANIVKDCKAIGIELVAITDHDTIKGVDEAFAQAEKLNIKIISGIELSTFDEVEIHVLGYNFDYKNKDLIPELEKLKARREKRNILMFQKMNNLGLKIDYNSLKNKYKGNLGRLHIAQELKDKGYVFSINEAFDKFIGADGPCYVKNVMINPQEAIDIIHRFGGKAVFAHPFKFIENGTITKLLDKYSFDGIETFYPAHSEFVIDEILSLSKKYNLFLTGGSDFHSCDSRNPLGSGNFDIDEDTLSILL